MADTPGAMGGGWAFIDLAGLGSNSLRSYAATLLRVVLLPIAFLALSFLAIYAAAAGHLLPPRSIEPIVLAAGFLSSIVGGAALAWGVARSHRRPWLSLISTDLRLDWRRLAIGAGVEGALLYGLVGVAHWAGGEPWPPGPSMPWPALAAIILMIPFQAASEEMLFRGYLTQALGRVVRSRVAIAVAAGLGFAVLHFNAYGPLTTPYLLVLSLIYSLVSLRDERLELTVGAHAATNWFGVGAFDALNTVHGGYQLDSLKFVGLIANGVVFYAVTRFLVRLCCDRRGNA